jgi:uncharacterized HAD superfamily protein/hypoxanthine phosphoribosyltransferase
MNFITYNDLNDCIYKNLNKVPRDIDLIVGIPRSGTLVANIVALYLNLPFTDIDNYVNNGILRVGNTRKCENWIKSFHEAKKVLIVDDSISSGKAIRQAKELLNEANLNCKYIYLAVYALENNIHMVDLFFKICHMPRMFEWNYMHHWALEYACVDIDGVLCEDPTIIENDDGKRYDEFLKNARPKFIPTKRIGYIVTTRLEKYRQETEGWLKKYNIQYDNLVMVNLPSGKDRIKNLNHGLFKAEVFKKTNCSIFIESSYEQAIEICKVSEKQVFCVENRQLISPDGVKAHLNILVNDWKFTSKRIIKKLLKKI